MVSLHADTGDSEPGTGVGETGTGDGDAGTGDSEPPWHQVR